MKKQWIAILALLFVGAAFLFFWLGGTGAAAKTGAANRTALPALQSAATEPMTAAPTGETASHPAVMPTRPASAAL